MAQPAKIIISQDTVGTGVAGESWKGGSSADAGGGKANKVRIINTNPQSGNTQVRLLWVPHGATGTKLDVDGEATLAQVSAHEWTFEPTAGVWGKWRIRARETVAGASVDEVRIFGIGSPGLGLFEPAFNEAADLNASLLSGGSPEIANSEDNEGGTFNGWQKDLRRMVEEIEGIVVGPGDSREVEYFSATLGQTVFALANTPNSPTNVVLAINGIAYENGVDYTVSGSTVTWLDVPFSLEAGDLVIADYMH